MTTDNLDQLSRFVLVGLLVTCLTLETFFPFVKTNRQRGKHILHNLGMLLINQLSFVLLASLLVSIISWSAQHRLGVLRLLPNPTLSPFMEALLGVVLFDFMEYWAHRFRHRVPFIWRFHQVHHADADLDASSSQRVHPGEMLFSLLYQALAAPVLGYSSLAFAAYFLVFTLFTIFQHANLSLPDRLDRRLSYLFSTPNVHKVHHSDFQPETDSNYADIFSLWDRLFGTFHYPADVQSIRFGLRQHPRPQSTTIWHQLSIPFRQSEQGCSAQAIETLVQGGSCPELRSAHNSGSIPH